MNQIKLIVTIFHVLVGILVFGIWSNAYVYGQQALSSTSPLLPQVADSSTSSPGTTTISPELKANMCDPNSPSLKVVNTTEARICGIAKTLKTPLVPAAGPQTSAVSSLTTTPAKLTAASLVAPPKQQQVATTNTVLQSNRYVTWATIASLGNVSNTSSPFSSVLGPQIKAVNQQQLQLLPITAINGTTGINGTAGQNYTLAAASPVPASDQLLSLGYHGPQGNSGSKHDNSDDSIHHSHTSARTVSDDSSKVKSTSIPTSFIRITFTDNDSTGKKSTDSSKSSRSDSVDDNSKPSSHRTTTSSGDSDSSATKKKTSSNTKLVRIHATDDSSSKDNSDSAAKSSSHDARSSSHDTDNGSTKKKKTTTKSDIARTTNDDSSSKKVRSSHNNDDDGDSKSSSSASSSDLGSSIENKVNSIVRNSLGGLFEDTD
jgi:hypothetical protein